MRILFLAHRLPYPPNKGDKIRSFWELSTLAERHEIDLFCFYDDPADKLQIPNLQQYCQSCYAEPISSLGSRIRAGWALACGRPLSKGFFRTSSMARRVAQAVRSRWYDLVFVFGSGMAQYAEPWTHLPRILDLVDVDSDKWLQYSHHKAGLASLLWKIEAARLERYEIHLVCSFSHTLVCTRAESQLLRFKIREGSIGVLENWLDLNYFDPESTMVPASIRALQPYIIFTGAMDYFPNIDAVNFFCTHVMPILRARMPSLRFVIAGRNPTIEVRRLAQNSAIHVTGSVPDIRSYLQGATAAVAPMRIARGVQNKILEALAMNLPVFASSTATAALPAEIASLVFVEDHPARLAERVLSLLENGADKMHRRPVVKRYFSHLDPSSQLHVCVSEISAVGRVRETKPIASAAAEGQGAGCAGRLGRRRAGSD